MRSIGVVVNPIAGMGGRVGLKGTDGTVEEARERGAEPRSPDRAREALEALAATDAEVTVLAPAGVMGADVARTAGLEPTIVTDPTAEFPETTATTSADDTREAVRAFLDRDVDLLLFAGGDGTAVDVAETLGERDDETPILGIPAGVKVFSSVFAVSPRAAGRIAGTFDEVETAEVNDIDEERYREGEVRAELRAVVHVPAARERQAGKQRVGGSVEALAQAVADDVRPGVTYVLGPGGTLGAVKSALGIDGSPLGVDVWRDGEVLVRDGGEDAILDALGDENVLIVSPIGGQGFVFGRGNQQLSPAVIRDCTVEIVASRRKIEDLGALRADTGDRDLDGSLRGWWRVRVGPVERRLVELV